MDNSIEKSQEAENAELALLRHIAMEGELSFQRDKLQAEHELVTQQLFQARQKRQNLIDAVQSAGGELPHWNL